MESATFPSTPVFNTAAPARVSRTLEQQGYAELGRASRGLVRVKPYWRRRFAARYRIGDVELLAAVDAVHDVLSGPATQKFCNGSATTAATGATNGWRRFRLPTWAAASEPMLGAAPVGAAANSYPLQGAGWAAVRQPAQR
jgi:hypothetical protein